MLEATNTRANNPSLNNAPNSAVKQAAQNPEKTTLTKKEITFPEFKDPYDINLGPEAKKAIHDAGADFQKSLGLDPKEMEAEAKAGEAKANNSGQPRLWDHPAIKVLNNIFKDDSPIRYALSLDNEIAEALDPTFDQLKAPTWVRNSVYRVLWSMAFLTTGTRAVLEGIKDGNWMSGLKKVVQDFVSVICATTAIARTANWIQDSIYNAIGLSKVPGGKLLQNFIRPAATLYACKKTIDYADPVGEYCGEKAFEFAKGLSKPSPAKVQVA